MNTNTFIKLLIAISPIALFSSCAKKNNDSVKSDTQHCILVVDKNTNAPLSGASVVLTLNAPINGQIDFPGSTDANGNVCIGIPDGGTVVSYQSNSFYYSIVSGTGIPSLIQLTPEARLTLYIYNDVPKDANDIITISYNHPTLGDSVIKTLNGANVDTSMSIYITPGMNTLKWTTTHLGVVADSSLGPIYMYANNTVRSIVY